MRFFEIGLILAGVLSLLFSLKNQSQKGWYGIAGANLALLTTHGIFEGLRYQMTFSYLIAVLLILAALAKTGGRFSQARTPITLKVISAGLAFILLGLASFLAYALPVFTLPEPTGSYAVGCQYFHLVDPHRADPFLDPSVQPRELMVKVYYPAVKEDSTPFAPYFHSPELVRAFAAFYHMPGFVFDQLNLVKTHSKEGLPLSTRQASYPIILFSHGAGTSMEVQTAQYEDLASHGYIVVAIDHTYVSAATAFPNRMVLHQEATTDFNTADPAEIITQIMADDVKFVMDQLQEINAGKFDSIFKGRMNLEHTGIAGHSVGGAVAYNLAINDPRIKAAVNLDGSVYVTPGSAQDIAPVLMLASGDHAETIQKGEILLKKLEDMTGDEQKMALSMYSSEAVYRDAYQKAQQNMTGLIEFLQTSGNLYTIEGSDHMKFTDMGLFIGFRPLREMIGIRGEMDPAACIQITQAVTRAFFDQHLKGETSQSLDALRTAYPDLKKVELE